MGAAVSFHETINVTCGGQKVLGAKTHLSSSSASVCSGTSRVSHCVKKEHIQMCMAIKC